MRKLKSVVISALVGALSIGNLYMGGTATQAASQAKQAKSAYMNFMKDGEKKFDVEYVDAYDDFDKITYGKWEPGKKQFQVKDFEKYTVKDINGDKVPELFLCKKETKDSEKVEFIATYIDGKVKPVFAASGVRNGIATAKGNKLSMGLGASNFDNYVFLKLDKDKLNFLNAYSAETEHLPKAVTKVTYKKNNKKCSKETYKKAVKSIKKQINCNKEI